MIQVTPDQVKGEGKSWGGRDTELARFSCGEDRFGFIHTQGSAKNQNDTAKATNERDPGRTIHNSSKYSGGAKGGREGSVEGTL